jgi:hypothetical protein
MGSFARHLVLTLSTVACVTSCQGVVADQGVDADLQVSGGQFFRNTRPVENGGPRVKTVTASPSVRPGSVGTCSGALEPEATGVALALDGDRGYWVLPAGLPDVASPQFPTFLASIAFGSRIRQGARTLEVHAVDEQGRFGPGATRLVNVAASARPTGRFVVHLKWDNDADLDLHVVEPSGVEIFKRNTDSQDKAPSGSPPEPGAERSGGRLDFDSNASCVRDGRRAESVVYLAPPPRGRYIVRVDAFSLCNQINAWWRVEAVLDGRTIGTSEGLATEVDTRFPHDRGAGVLALEIDVP